MYPTLPTFPLRLALKFIREDRGKPCFPIPHGLVGKFEAAHQEEFRDISVTQLVAESAQQHLEENIGGYFNEVKRSAGTFIEGVLTVFATENGVSQVGGAF